MKSKIVKIPVKYKEEIEKRFIKVSPPTYANIVATKGKMCEDHFTAMAGCGNDCPFKPFQVAQSMIGCVAWLESIVKGFGTSTQPPEISAPKWKQEFPAIVAQEAHKYIEWIE